MSEPLPLLSIVAPAFNEEAVLPFFHREMLRVADSLREELDVEIIYVDDGSRDRTPELLVEFAKRDPRVRYVLLSRNFGHQAAMTAGLEYAYGDAIVTLDSDLQHPPAVIIEMLAKWRAGAEVVLGVREESSSTGFFKNFTSRMFHRGMRWCSGMELRSTVSEFRLISRKALNALLEMPERLRYLRGMIHWLGFPTDEVSFAVPPRAAGHTKFTVFRMIQLARDGLLSFSRVPLHAALIASGAMLAFSFIACLTAWFIWRPERSGGWLALSVVIATHCGAAGIWVALVAFSEYLARIHEQVLGRPIYVVHETSEGPVVSIKPMSMKPHRKDSAAA
jgi:dolichol-phosphate mannosyltransferase